MRRTNREKRRIWIWLLLHIMLMVYSLSGVFSKLASQTMFLSRRFCLYYSVIIALLGFYAIVWQQIIKYLPLTTAFSNKAITVIWGIVWGVLFFHEYASPGKIIGAVIVVTGIIMYSIANEEDNNG